MEDAPVIETVVTTLNPDGGVNCAAMGVEWGEERIVIKPFRGTRTLRNLRATPAAVVNLTDDVLLFSQAALGDPHPPTRPAAAVEGAVLDDACSWREVRVESIDDSAPRARVDTVVVGSGTRREFLGLDRARHAVLEASILASRARMLMPRRPGTGRGGCGSLVDRPADRVEHEAMRSVRAVLGTDARGTRSGGARAPAPGHARGRRRWRESGASAGSECRSAGPAVVLEAGAGRGGCPPTAPDSERALTFARRCRDASGLSGGAHSARRRGGPPARGSRLGHPSAGARRRPGAGDAGRARRRRAGSRRGGGARRTVGGRHVDVRGRRSRGRGRAHGLASSARAPLLARHPMPEEWRADAGRAPAAPGLSGGAEGGTRFGRLERSGARAIGRHRAAGARPRSPALVERELEEFGTTLTRIQELVGDSFAAAQGGQFHPRAGALVEALLRFGAAGAARAVGTRRSTGSSAAGGRTRAARRMEDLVGGEGTSSSSRSTTAAPASSGHEATRERRGRRRGARRRRGGGRDRGRRTLPRARWARRPRVIAGVRAAVPAELPVSAAIGDMPNLPGTAALAALGAARSGATFVKVGLWGVSTEGDAVDLLRAVRRRRRGHAGRGGGGSGLRGRPARSSRAAPGRAAAARRARGGRRRLPTRHHRQGRPRAAGLALARRARGAGGRRACRGSAGRARRSPARRGPARGP